MKLECTTCFPAPPGAGTGAWILDDVLNLCRRRGCRRRRRRLGLWLGLSVGGVLNKLHVARQNDRLSLRRRSVLTFKDKLY